MCIRDRPRARPIATLAQPPPNARSFSMSSRSGTSTQAVGSSQGLFVQAWQRLTKSRFRVQSANGAGVLGKRWAAASAKPATHTCTCRPPQGIMSTSRKAHAIFSRIDFALRSRMAHSEAAQEARISFGGHVSGSPGRR